jgi:phage/plasmid-like protein (TIGR03299 family)
MSRETMEHLNTQTLIGYTEKRGHAWHYRADLYRRLFNWSPLEAEVQAVAITEDGVLSVTDPTRKAIVRSDLGTVLGIFKQGYQVHRYEDWLVGNVEAILDADLQIGSAGLLRGGAVAWVQVEMEDTMTVEGVEFRPFLTAATSLDGSLASTYITGAQVVVCDNTLSAALGEFDNRFKVKHSRHSLGKMSEVRDALQIVHGVGDAFSAQVEQLVDETVNAARWAKFVEAYTEPSTDSKRAQTNASDKADALNRLWFYDDRVSPWHGTAYGVLAAVNTYVHHEGEVRGADRATRNMERVVFGKVDDLDKHTLKVLATV